MNENLKNTLIVNLFGGPCAGCSTMRARVFSELKYRQIECEESLEYAKDKTWEESWKTLDNQIYIFGKQHHKLFRLAGNVKVIVTDSPLPMAFYYDKTQNSYLKNLVLQQFNQFNNINFFLDRKHEYSEAGRTQNEEEADEIAEEIENLLIVNSIQYIRAYSSPDKAMEIANYIQNNYI